MKITVDKRRPELAIRALFSLVSLDPFLDEMRKSPVLAK
jgi:hypothetical protein